MTDIWLKLQEAATALRDFITSLLAPSQTRTDELDTFYSDLLTRSKYNARKMVMQRALNQIFGLAANSIRIVTDTSAATLLYFYQPAELVNVFFYQPSENNPVFFTQAGEIAPGATDFVVLIPIGIYTAELDRRVKAEVSKLNLAGKTFSTATY